MKAQKVTQARQGFGPAAGQSEGVGVMQRKVASTPRQTGEAAHIAQLKGDGKAKASPPKNRKGK